MSSKRFALIGSGRVASHLAPAIVSGGMECVGVYSPTQRHAEMLAEKLHCAYFPSLSDLLEEVVDFVLISIKDDAIKEVAQYFPSDFQGVVIHTSGATSIDALASLPHRGVLYPMQTFSHERELDISEVPIFPEASDQLVSQVISEVTKAMGSKQVHYLTSEERVQLHLASVFACNFVNHLYALSDEIMNGIGLDFSSLSPLVRETLQKALSSAPKEVQTGPAIRQDHKTIDRHLSMLKGFPREVYEVITKSIIDGQLSDK